MKRLLFFILLSINLPLYAWNVNGHLLVAEIANENLRPQARQNVAALAQRFAQSYPQYQSFQLGSVWPDNLRGSGDERFNRWHFINRPLNQDGFQHRYYPKQNVVWAINQSEMVLQDPKKDAKTKAQYLMFLAHFVADVHQPLHTVNLYSQKFPRGDKGGALYTITAPHVKNLHQLWDSGGGFFYRYRHSNALSMKGIPDLAQKIQHDYPVSFFGSKVTDLNPTHWSYESYNLAKNVAYKTAYKRKPSKSYIAKTQQISEQQIALAGYRLAGILNKIE